MSEPQSSTHSNDGAGPINAQVATPRTQALVWRGRGLRGPPQISQQQVPAQPVADIDMDTGNAAGVATLEPRWTDLVRLASSFQPQKGISNLPISRRLSPIPDNKSWLKFLVIRIQRELERVNRKGKSTKIRFADIRLRQIHITPSSRPQHDILIVNTDPLTAAQLLFRPVSRTDENKIAIFNSSSVTWANSVGKWLEGQSANTEHIMMQQTNLAATFGISESASTGLFPIRDDELIRSEVTYFATNNYRMLRSKCLIDMVVISCPPIMVEKGATDWTTKQYQTMRQKLEYSVRAACAAGARTLVLSPFGCGYSHNPPSRVARLFAEVLLLPSPADNWPARGMNFVIAIPEHLDSKVTANNEGLAAKPIRQAFRDVFYGYPGCRFDEGGEELRQMDRDYMAYLSTLEGS